MEKLKFKRQKVRRLLLKFLIITCGFTFLLLNFAFAEDTATILRGMGYNYDKHYSVEFRNADLKDALRFLAKVSNVNIIIPEDVNGIVSTSFESTSLKDAINSIVKANGLDYAIENGIWRVGKSDQFTTAGEDLKTETFRLKYASAKDLPDKVKSLLTNRGSVLADERTNSIVVRERPANIENVRRFLEDIDIRDAQVLIEAKIVEANRDFSRSLGIQWAVTSTGTSAQVQGLQAVGTADSGNNLIQNLPSPSTPSSAGATSGVGLLIGQLAGGTSIDVQISAAEQSGNLTIISEPQIVTSNGVTAKIRSGETIYIKTTGDITVGQVGTQGTTAGSSGLQEVQTGIELNVTPQISVDNYIKLNIATTTSQLDFTRTVDGIPVIIDSDASTSVVIKDGETTIIGGLSKLTGTKTKRDVPGLSRIPILGNLFKSRARYKQNKDLMIFIKPTIVRSIADIPTNAKYGQVVEMRESMVIADEKKKPRPRRSDTRSTNKYLKGD